MNLINMLALLSVPTVMAAATIRGTVQVRRGGSLSPVAGALVSCYDQDDFSSDDSLGSAFTSSSGFFSIGYRRKSTGFFGSGWDPGFGGIRNPDIYCKVFGNGSILGFTTTIRQDQNQGSALDWGIITVYPVRRNGRTNGCGTDLFRDVPGISLDIVPDFFFTDDCNNHDQCYDDCNESKQDCDDELHELIRSRCRQRYGDGARTATCSLYAEVSMKALSASGSDDAYNASQRENGCARRLEEKEMVNAAVAKKDKAHRHLRA